MKFIELTYYNEPNRYGTGGAKTTKKFYLNINTISYITDYDECTKITLLNDSEISVCETFEEIRAWVN